MWIPYIIFREAYLQVIREYAYVSWADCHEAGIIPPIAGC